MKVTITTVDDKGTMAQNRFAVSVEGEVTMPRASRAQVLEFLDGIDLRAEVTFDGEPIDDYEDVDMWFAPRV